MYYPLLLIDIGFNGMTELFGPFIEYNPTAAMDDNKLTHVQNYINSIVEIKSASI